MAKHRNRTAQADGFDPYSARRFMKGRKSPLAGVNHQNLHDKRGMWSGWGILILGVFVFALVMLVIN